MDKKRLTYLLDQYLADTATHQELQYLSVILKEDADRELFKTILEEKMSRELPVYPPDQESWQKMVQDILSIDKVSAKLAESSPARVLGLFKWSVAAAILVLVCIGIYLLTNRIYKPDLTVNDRATGYTVISTAFGEQQEVVLPDGSHVWLNSGSSIRFPASFHGRERSLELAGEAWFDIKHGDITPFFIHSGPIITTVLGTAFDIKAYPGQKMITVSVQQGKVNVQAGNKILATLEKGRQVRVNADTTIVQRNIDTSAIAAWKQGDLYYKDETVEDIFADLQRVFKDSIQIKNASLKVVKVNASFNKRIGLQKAVEMICGITGSQYSYRNGKFTIE